MVIANACGHPDCQNTRDMLMLAQASIEELSRELGKALAERDTANSHLEAAKAIAKDWHKIADSRAAEIIRLMGENEALRAELAKGGKS